MYENVTYDYLLNRMLSRVSNKLDKREGSIIFDTHSPTALELEALYIELERLISESYGDTASREYLILRCKERGITPYKAVHAVLKGVFTPDNIDVLDKRFNIGEINYKVTEKISDGVYQVTCETAGAEGNRHFGDMIPIDYIQGLQTAELTEILIPGEDEEDTESLRQRYFDSFNEKSFGGNVRDYLAKTNSIPGVGGVKVTRVWNSDIRPSDMIPNENVKSWFDSVKNSLPDDVLLWLQTVFKAASEKKLTTGGTVLLTILDAEFSPASDALIKLVEQTMDPVEYTGEGMGLAPIGHIVSVKSADSIPVFVSLNLEFSSGFSWDNLNGVIKNAVNDYLISLRKKWADSDKTVVRISQIEMRLLDISGIADIHDTKINGAESNLILDSLQIPILGGVDCG